MIAALRVSVEGVVFCCHCGPSKMPIDLSPFISTMVFSARNLTALRSYTKRGNKLGYKKMHSIILISYGTIQTIHKGNK